MRVRIFQLKERGRVFYLAPVPLEFPGTSGDSFMTGRRLAQHLTFPGLPRKATARVSESLKFKYVKTLLRSLYFRVIVAIVSGVLLGFLYPEAGAMNEAARRWVHQAHQDADRAGDLLHGGHGYRRRRRHEEGREDRRTRADLLRGHEHRALIVGLAVVNILRPGSGMNVDPRTLDTASVAAVYRAGEMLQSVTDFLLSVIPTTVVDAFAKGEILQVLLFAVLFGFALQRLGSRGAPVLTFIDGLSQVLFGIVGVVMKVAPLGAFGAMAFTIGKYGFGSLRSLAELMACFYGPAWSSSSAPSGWWRACTASASGKFVKYIGDELFIVLGTSSSESVLAEDDRQAAENRRRQIGRWVGDTGGLFVQSRRHVDLPERWRPCSSRRPRTRR